MRVWGADSIGAGQGCFVWKEVVLELWTFIKKRKNKKDEEPLLGKMTRDIVPGHRVPDV